MQTANDLQQKLLENSSQLMDWIKSVAEKSTNFVGEQTPIFIQEYLRWHFYEALLKCISPGIISITLLLLYIAIHRHISKLNKDKYFDRCEFPYPLSRILSCIMLLLTILIACVNILPNINTMVKIKVAPRVYLVDNFLESIKRINK